MVTPEEREFLWDFYAPQPRMRLNLGIRRRLAPLLQNDRAKIELANSILFTLPGTPVLYYGDEIAMGDNIWLNDRNGVRTPMQWSAAVNAGFSDAPVDRLYSPPIDDPLFGYGTVNVEAQRADPASLYHTIRKMIRMRKQHPGLTGGDFQPVDAGNRAVLAYGRSSGSETMLVINNLSAARQAVRMDLAHLVGSAPTDVLTGAVLPPVVEPDYRLHLESCQYLWLRLDRQPAA
jgi:maltose alpha-D-glucosyltransferase/alpha-amylase